MPAKIDGHPHPDISESCRGNCSGYGSRCCCPPLIVLAMHSQHAAGQPCHHSHIDESAAVTLPDYSASKLVSGEFCSCMFPYRAHEAGAKIEM